MSQTYLILGGLGFIGRSLVRFSAVFVQFFFFFASTLPNCFFGVWVALISILFGAQVQYLAENNLAKKIRVADKVRALRSRDVVVPPHSPLR